MYRVMIVDDEPVIVRGLTRIVDWKKWDCEVVATAEGGQEGMALIEQYKPDILFSDISMPGVDGLSMIAGIKAQFPNMQITILTGYRDFDYAQRAIRLGVTRFLLKPSKMDEIEEAIEAMQKKLQQSVPAEEKAEEKTDKNEGEYPDTEDTGDEDSAANSFIVRNALSYMEENYGQKLKLGDVAEQIYVSQWHLSKLLNKHTGQSFSELLNHIRIEKAKTLLENPALRIGSIAEEVGFLDMAHFSRVFKKQAGVSANEYRNRILGK